MVVFPQLSTGAGAQYPMIRRRRVRTAANHLRDGSVITYADTAFASNGWDLALRDLTDEESEAVRHLFESVEGRRGTFTFVDPSANLLAHSDVLQETCWLKGPLVQITAGIDDPLGGRRGVRLTNAAQTVQAVSQLLEAPAWFTYTFSAYVRAAGQTNVALTRSTPSISHSRQYGVGPGWTRCVLSGALNTSGTAVRFSLELPAATAVDIFGMQVEAQPCASAYKATGDRDGIYKSARFDDDVLQLISDGPDQHRYHLRIVARD
jgi:hypothetical protein